MHQPFYKRLDTGDHAMPWVRLHGTKDYLDMPLLVEERSGMKATFNLVPSLVEQLEEFAQGAAKERTLELSRKAAIDLSPEEKRFIVANFFQCNHERMILPFARYEELYSRRGWARTPAELDRVLNYFNNEDILDLQVWFNLAWIDPLLRERDKSLAHLVRKGSHFTEEEKSLLLDKCLKIIGEVIPTYKRLQEKNIIEVSVSPFYHPILPLLYNTNFCRRPRPQCPTPKLQFNHPEDAAWHINAACEFYKSRFGRAPRGMWPSEGSVCPEIIPLFTGAGLSWIATDEEILALSLGSKLFARDAQGSLSEENAQKLYQPYRATYQGAEVTVFFRDHALSDLIGFQYAGWEAKEAVEHFILRLKKISKLLQDDDEPYVVSIILDGENCWEFYQDDGLPFLRLLYERIATDPELMPTTPSEYMAAHPPRRTIKGLYTGSWINHDFHIWIGHEDDRLSWERLAQTRQDVMRQIENPQANLSTDAADLARKAIAIAEGSDWNWWYGDDHSSGIDDQFDLLYRNYLMQAYSAAGMEIPPRLYVPIMSTVTGAFREPAAFLKPTIDGRVTSYFEWLAAGIYEVPSGSMHRRQHVIRSIRFGFDAENLFIRIDPDPDILTKADREPLTFIVAILEPVPSRLKVKIGGEVGRPLTLQCYTEKENGTWAYAFSLETVAFARIIEMGIPFQKIGLSPGMVMNFQVIVQSKEHEIERCPDGAPVRMVIPDRDFEETVWMV